MSEQVVASILEHNKSLNSLNQCFLDTLTVCSDRPSTEDPSASTLTMYSPTGFITNLLEVNYTSPVPLYNEYLVFTKIDDSIQAEFYIADTVIPNIGGLPDHAISTSKTGSGLVFNQNLNRFTGQLQASISITNVPIDCLDFDFNTGNCNEYVTATNTMTVLLEGNGDNSFTQTITAGAVSEFYTPTTQSVTYFYNESLGKWLVNIPQDPFDPNSPSVPVYFSEIPAIPNVLFGL